jgi:hypothetical protein
MRTLLVLIFGGAIALTTGCVERRVTYVPVYPSQPVYQGQPVYTYPNQTVYASPSGAVPARGDGGQLVTVDANTPPATLPTPTQVVPQTPPPAVIAPSAPPPTQVEVVPVAPGPDYAWAPGYWSWDGHVWIWVGGRWALRPYPRAVWTRPHWERHGRGYVWRGGHWR